MNNNKAPVKNPITPGVCETLTLESVISTINLPAYKVLGGFWS